jgi:hypothetical protein
VSGPVDRTSGRQRGQRTRDLAVLRAAPALLCAAGMKVTAQTRPLTAMDVAESFIRASRCRDDPFECRRVREVVLLVGQHLAERARYGRWEEFDAGRFYQQIAALDADEQIGITVRLLGLYAFLAGERRIVAPRARVIIDAIDREAPDNAVTPALVASCRRLCEAITELSALQN